MGKFSDKVFGANVDQKTKDIFNALQRGQYEFSPGESVTDLPEHSKYLGEKTTFARMWVALHATGSDVVDEIFYHSVNDNKSNSYEPNQSIDGESYFVEGIENPFLKPTAGITSISSRTEGDLGAVKRTTVEFVVHNKQDFDEIYLPFFLRPGATVVVDFGWSDKNIELYDIETQLANTDTELRQLKKFIYGGKKTGPNGEEIFTNSNGKRYYQVEDGVVVIEDEKNLRAGIGWIDNHKGLVDTNIGIVQTYNSKVNQNGSFECSIELVSQNATILDNEISSDNNLKFIFQNKIEDILIEALTKENLGGKITDYNVLSAKDKQEHLDKFFDISDNKVGRINTPSAKLGIYFESAAPENQKSLYISFGVFNDLFLNNFVAKNKNNEERYAVNFKLVDYYVRYEENLYRRQVATMSGGDELPVFLYPVKWSETKDSKKGNTENVASVENQKIGKNPFKTPVIPLREIFVNVSTIKEAFSKKQNVNDAIKYILNSINDDSYGVFDLKMIAPNPSYSEIGIQDNNLLNPIANEDSLLVFDVTSGNGVVTNMDYSFETPKGDLQNMLAIGNKIDLQSFDVTKLDNLNFLNVLKDKKREGKEAFIRSLPLNEVDEPEDKISSDEVDVRIPQDYFKEQVNFINVAGYKKGFDTLVTGLQKKATNVSNKNKKNAQPEPNKDNDKKTNTLSASTDRDYWGKRAKSSQIFKDKEGTISPILPINLTLSVYGNTHLNIGDVFTTNFLPKSYSPYVYFQIMGVEHKLGSNWETTYQTQYRVRPEAKGKVVVPTDVKFSKGRIESEMKNSNADDALINSIDNMEIVDTETPSKKMIQKVKSEKELKKEIAETGGISNLVETSLLVGSVNSTQHIKMAYAWTQTLLTYIHEKQSKEGFTVLYKVKRRPDSRPILMLESLEKYDIIVDVDVAYEDKDDSSLYEIYKNQQSTSGGGIGINDDQEVADSMFETQAKKKDFEWFINVLTAGQEGTVAVVEGKLKKETIDKNVAPIISRIQIKTTDIGSSEPGEFYTIKPLEIAIEPSKGFFPDFISTIQIPTWFVINKNSKSLDDFTNKFKENFDNVTIPKKVSALGF
jgi:hypothetical protein